MKYNISPFDPDFKQESSQTDRNDLLNYLNSRFGIWRYTARAREAIKIALSYYDLSREDVVTILTTSNNYYISSCVTNAIETVCKWSRDIQPKTKVIFVNHEFGYPYEGLEMLKESGYPIIEDCAYAFFSESKDGRIGRVGDFAIYSLPKAFPVESGGILVCNNPAFVFESTSFDGAVEKLHQDLASHFKSLEQIKTSRIYNYNFLLLNLKPLGVEPYFDLNEGVVPGVFLFKWHGTIDYPALKVYMQSHGVECSVFYGENAFFIPMHHLLTKDDMLYFCELLRNFNG